MTTLKKFRILFIISVFAINVTTAQVFETSIYYQNFTGQYRGNFPTASISQCFGKLINDVLYIGAGVGLDVSEIGYKPREDEQDEYKRPINIPVSIRFKALSGNNETNPYLAIDAGYSIPITKESDEFGDEYLGYKGHFVKPEIGIMVAASENFALGVQANLRIQFDVDLEEVIESFGFGINLNY